MDNYVEFVLELQINFGPHDPVKDVEHELWNLSMRDGQWINKYVVKFNCLASQVHGYGEGALCNYFYNGLPDHIKDNMSCIGKPATLSGMCNLVQTIDACYWEHKSELGCTSMHFPKVTLAPSETSGTSTSTSTSTSIPTSDPLFATSMPWWHSISRIFGLFHEL